jgi:hypothetical protein
LLIDSVIALLIFPSNCLAFSQEIVLSSALPLGLKALPNSALSSGNALPTSCWSANCLSRPLEIGLSVASAPAVPKPNAAPIPAVLRASLPYPSSTVRLTVSSTILCKSDSVILIICAIIKYVFYYKY